MVRAKIGKSAKFAGMLLAWAAAGAPARPQAPAPPGHPDATQIAAEAQSALRQGDYPQAIAGFEKLVKLAPAVAEIHANLAVAYYFSGRFSDAARACREALKLKPALTQAREFLGPSLAESGRCREALRAAFEPRLRFRRL